MVGNKPSFLIGAGLCLFISAIHSIHAEEKTNAQDEVLNTFQPTENWFLPTGYEIRATIQNAIFSFNLVTPVIAIVDEPVVCPKNNAVIFPKKTKLIGTADILKSDDRVNIRFIVAVLPNGREFAISGIALSPDGSAGVKGAVKEYKDTRLISSAMSGALQGVSQGVSMTLAGQPITGQAIGGALQQASQQVSEIGREKVDVSVTVPPFARTLVFLMSRLSLDNLLSSERKQDPRPASQEDKNGEKKNWREK